MPHFKVQITRTIEEQNYLNIEAGNAGEAADIAEYEGFPTTDWDFLAVKKEDISVIKLT